ncbi:hypothetical protein CsatB_029273 [Cannabis sativa]
MTMNNPMVSLLTDNELNRANFIKWRENINIALIGENSMFVLTEEALEQPEIMNQLTELFGMASIQACFEATKNFINARMKPHQSVRDHLLKMTSYFQEAENHGAVIDQTTQTFGNWIGGPQKGGTKAPSSSTTNGTAKVEANIASTSM